MKRKLVLAGLLVVLSVAIVASIHRRQEEAKGFVFFFQRASHSLKIDRSGAHFHTRHFGPKFAMGEHDQPGRKGWQFEFTLSQPGERFYSPSHHEMREFIVKRVTANSIVLGYKSSFNSGFGWPTSSSGEITLYSFDNGTNFQTEDAETPDVSK